MSIRRLIATAAGGLAIAFAAGPKSPLYAQGNQNDINADSKFIVQIAADNIFEIRLGTLAEKKATNPAVKQFGQQMVADHTRLEDQLTALVSKGRPFLPGLGQQHEQEFNQLEKLSGAEFDRAYMTSMIQNHQNAVNTYQTQGQTAHSTEVRQYVTGALPTLQQHLSMAGQVGSQVGAGPAVVVTPQNPPAPAQNPPVPAQNPPVVTQGGQVGQADIKPDREFIRDVTAASVMEIRLGQMAQRKATNPSVRQFADRMVTDFTGLQSQWTGMASRNGMPFQPGMGPLHQQKVDRLQNVSGAEFDRAYMTTVIQHHQALLPYFQQEVRSAHSVPVRSLVDSGLPTLQQHLTLAQQAGSQVGVDTATTLTQRAPGKQGDVKSDRAFIRDVLADNVFEIRVGHMAENKAENRAVKEFGRRMVTDHTRLQNQWSGVASRNGLVLKPGMGDEHQRKVDRLQKLSGKQFDRVYMTLMIQGHKNAVDNFQNEGRSAHSAPVRRLVDDGLPILEQHLTLANQVAGQVGVDTTAVRNGRVSIRNAQQR